MKEHELYTRRSFVLRNKEEGTMLKVPKDTNIVAACRCFAQDNIEVIELHMGGFSGTIPCQFVKFFEPKSEEVK